VAYLAIKYNNFNLPSVNKFNWLNMPKCFNFRFSADSRFINAISFSCSFIDLSLFLSFAFMIYTSVIVPFDEKIT